MTLSDREFSEKLEKLNSLYGHMGWQPAAAREELTDIYGQTIKRHEIYYQRVFPPDTLKLSRGSIEKLLFSLFHLNGKLNRVTEVFLNGQVNLMPEPAIELRQFKKNPQF